VDPAITVIPGIQVVEVFGMPGAGEAANSRRSS
jgi:hypothetical protein